jgi:hypothetical protein
MLQEVLEIDWVALRTSTSGRRGRDAKACTAHALAGREWKRTPARTNSVGEVVHVRQERKGASRSEEKKKNGKRNDPGKAQSINGCGAEVKHCSGSGQARFIFLARGWDKLNCGLKFLRGTWGRKCNKECGLFRV